MTAPITARDISDACDAKPLAKFGSKSVERVRIEPVRTRITLSAAMQDRSSPGLEPASTDPAGMGRDQEVDRHDR